jgi:hypothetical protein
VQVEHNSRARCAQAGCKFRTYQPRKELKDCCCKESAQSRRIQYLEVFEGLPQGVRAGVFLKTRVVEKAQEG